MIALLELETRDRQTATSSAIGFGDKILTDACMSRRFNYIYVTGATSGVWRMVEGHKVLPLSVRASVQNLVSAQ